MKTKYIFCLLITLFTTFSSTLSAQQGARPNKQGQKGAMPNKLIKGIILDSVAMGQVLAIEYS